MKINRIVAFSILLLVCFSVGVFLARKAMDTKIFESQTCKHSETVPAVLKYQSKVGGCYWLVDNDDQVSGEWFNCGGIATGQTVEYTRTNFSCDDLLAKTSGS